MKFLHCVTLALSAAIASVSSESILLERGTVITFDEDAKLPLPLYNTSVLITGSHISAIFPADDEDSVSIPDGTERVDAQGKIVSPGFIDTHRHGWQTVFRTLASNGTLAEYFVRYGEYSQANTVFQPNDIYYSHLAGVYEAINSGVTSILDHAHGIFSENGAEAYLEAAIESGVRMWFCPAIHDLGNGYSVQDQMDTIRKMAGRGDLNSSSLVQLGLAYDGFSSNRQDEIQSVMALAESIEIAILTTHHNSGVWLLDNSPTRLRDLGYLNSSYPIVFSHATSFTPQDAALLRQHDLYISTAPESEMHLGMDNTDAWLIQDQTVLGNDSPFLYSTDLVGKARMWLQDTRQRLFQQTFDRWEIPSSNPMSANQAFLLATRSGGRALHRGSDLGVLREGAKADLVVFDGTSPNMLGWSDPVAAVILHSNVGDVQHVLIDGQWRKRDFQLTASGGPKRFREVQREFLRSADRIQRIWKNTPIPTFNGLYEHTIPYARPVHEDVVAGEGTGY